MAQPFIVEERRREKRKDVGPTCLYQGLRDMILTVG